MTAAQPLPGVPWYDISDPASAALDELAARFNFHELQIEDCRHRQQRAKTEEHSRYIFTVIKHLHDANDVEFDDLDIFLGPDYLVTVHDGENGVLSKVVARAKQDGITRTDKLFYVILDTVVDEYLPLLDTIAEQISDLESSVISNPSPDCLAQMLTLKRKLIAFRRAAAMMREVVNVLQRREGGHLGDDLDPYLRDVYDHLVRTVELIEMHRDLLTGSMDIYMSAVANRTNDVMKLLTVWGTVALPFVIVTGFFGMNLHLPFAQSRLGAAVAVGMMFAAASLILLYFRRKNWI